MRDQGAPGAYYDGPLKELAAALASLVAAMIWWALPTFLCVLCIILDQNHAPGVLKIVIFSSFYITFCCCWIYMAYACIRLVRLLFRHVWVPLSFLAILPLTTLPCALFLWIYAVRQLRARGVQAGVFGIDPGRVD